MARHIDHSRVSPHYTKVREQFLSFPRSTFHHFFLSIDFITNNNKYEQ